MPTSRRGFAALLATGAVLGGGNATPFGRSIREFGARGAPGVIDTAAIQQGIDTLAARGGGRLVVPEGTFVSGALFLRPGVHLHLARGAVLKCTNDMAHFPPRRTRIEGHFEPSFTPALINAEGCHGLRISGEGVLDGSGRPVWDEFWRRRRAARDPHDFANTSLPRARLAFIANSRDVVIEDVTFRNSQFWNLHLYACEDVRVRRARFTVPDNYPQAPSSDGIDIDSCRRVLVEDCYFSVTDDCIAAKGSKGPHAREDKASPPVEQVHVRGCHFRRGHHAFACGSEATVVRDVLVEDCRVSGAMVLAQFKLRPDTPQLYERIVFRAITLDSDGGALIAAEPWTQYREALPPPLPQSCLRAVTLADLRGRFGSFGVLRPNPGQTRIEDIAFRDIDVELGDPALVADDVARLSFTRVRVNAKERTAPLPR
ncbi:hypothetical protein HT136_13430 [Novosphingobium profundi]|uniref:glycoside hydrolase family 28 protein n=1 Tax=Novosphingobium profundi TaxID=1774954 RepID=UPI001BDA5796|nr:glycosyl hydrolase family 28 protein [Novosphingobium profundi]MBT0669367.1 hypothetical protein [Novosphingobium profundi]